MGLIKSALELAMEKTVGLEVDKVALRQKEKNLEGRTVAIKALIEGVDFLTQHWNELKKEANKDDQASWLEGALLALLGRFSLTTNPEVELDMNAATPLLLALTRNKAQSELTKMKDLVVQFGQEVIQLKSALEKQVGPQLRQRAEDYARQSGVQMRFILEKDPTFLKILTQNLDPLKVQYSESLEDLKSQVLKYK